MKNIKKIIAVTCTLMIAGSDSSIAANALSPETYEAIAYNCRHVEDPYYVLETANGTFGIIIRLDENGKARTYKDFNKDGTYEEYYMTYGSVYDGMHCLLYSDGVKVKDLGMTVEELNSKIAMQSQAEEEKLENETTAPETTTPETTAPETTSTLISEDGYITIDADLKPTLLGDADCDGERDISDVVLLSKGILGNATISEQGKVNCDLDKSSDEDINTLNAKDTVVLMNLLIHRIPSSDLPLTK